MFNKEICTKCKGPRIEPVKDSAWCKDCRSEYNKTLYQKDKARINKKNRHNSRFFIEHVAKYLVNNPCVDCGEARIWLLDFDHIGTKTHNIASLVKSKSSIAIFDEEVKECEIRCLECHRLRTSENGNYFRLRLQKLLDQNISLEKAFEILRLEDFAQVDIPSKTLEGTKNGMAKFTEEDIRAIRSSKDSTYKIAKEYKVNYNTIKNIRTRKNWTHVL